MINVDNSPELATISMHTRRPDLGVSSIRKHSDRPDFVVRFRDKKIPDFVVSVVCEHDMPRVSTRALHENPRLLWPDFREELLTGSRSERSLRVRDAEKDNDPKDVARVEAL